MPFFPEWNTSMWGGAFATPADIGASGSGLVFSWDLQGQQGVDGEGGKPDEYDPLAMFRF
jgi:hypothetical protein